MNPSIRLSKTLGSAISRARSSRFASLRFRLLVLVILAFFPSLILTVYSAYEQRQNAEAEARQTALRLVRLAASNQNQLVEGARQLLIALAALPAVRDRSGPDCNPFFQTLLAQYPLYANIWAVDALEERGNVICSGVPYSEPVNVAEAPYFMQTLEARDFTGCEYTQEPIGGAAVLPYGYPIPPGWAQPQAVVFAGIDLNWLNGFVADAGLPPGSTLSVTDRNGRILARYPHSHDVVGSSLDAEALKPLLADKEGVVEGVGSDGVARFYAFKVLCCLANGDVYVRIGIPKATAFAEPARALRRNLLALGAVSLFALLAAWFGGNFAVVHEVQRLVRTTQRLAAGDLRARTGLAEYSGEFSQLADSLDQMAGALEKREAESKDTEAALRQHGERTEALVRIAGRLNTRLDLNSVLTTVCDAMASAMNARAAVVGLYDPQSDSLSYASKCGLPEEAWGGVLPLLRAVAEAGGETAGASQIRDICAIPGFSEAEACAEADIRSFASATMIHEGRLVGYLHVFTAQALTDDQLAMLRGLADQASLAISNARLYAALQHEQRLSAGLLEKVISAQEEERKRIARELHDDTSQGLTASILSLDAAQLALRTGGQKVAEHVATGKAIVEQVLEGTHRLMRDLRPALLDDLGLLPAIQAHAEERLQPMDIAYTVEGDGCERRLPAVVETALFRIAQEAITNVVRHSGASRVRVTLSVNGQSALLAVEDNGVGFDVGSAVASGQGERGLGLRGMQERAAALGGRCTIESAVGKGTVVQVDVPNVVHAKREDTRG